MATLEVARGLGLTVLASNLQAEDGQELPVSRHLVRELHGLRVGLIGLVGGTVAGARVEEPAAAARRELAALRGRVDLMVCLSNLGLEADAALAAEVGGMDFILGAGDDRMILRPREAGDGRLLQPYKNGEYLGLIRLRVRPATDPADRGWADEIDIEELSRRLGKADAAEAEALRARIDRLRGLRRFRAVLRPLHEDLPEDEGLRQAVLEELARETRL